MAMTMQIGLNEIENVDRVNLAKEINNVFNGRVPSSESDFKSVVSDARAEEILAATVRLYEELGFDVKYNTHDLFVLYEEVMR